MPDTTERDLVELVEQLLAKATPGPFDVYPIKTLKGDITGFTWGKYLSDQRDADHFWSSELVPFDDAQLYSRSYELLRRLVEEVKRLKRGEFTSEEFQNLCHNADVQAGFDAFADGCEAYQEKLFGRCRKGTTG